MFFLFFWQMILFFGDIKSIDNAIHSKRNYNVSFEVLHKRNAEWLSQFINTKRPNRIWMQKANWDRPNATKFGKIAICNNVTLLLSQWYGWNVATCRI